MEDASGEGSAVHHPALAKARVMCSFRFRFCGATRAGAGACLQNNIAHATPRMQGKRQSMVATTHQSAHERSRPERIRTVPVSRRSATWR